MAPAQHGPAHAASTKLPKDRKLRTIHWIGIGVFLVLMIIGAIQALVSGTKGSDGSSTSADKKETEDKSLAEFNKSIKACEAGDGKSCNHVATVYDLGKEKPLVEKNPTKARRYYQRACDLKQGWGCVWAAEFYEQGKGGKRTLPRAWATYKKACEMNNGEGCNKLTELTLKNTGVKAEGFDLRIFYTKMCDSKVPVGCFHLAVAHAKGYQGGVDVEKAFRFFNKGCGLAQPDSCLNAGALLYTGKVGKKDHTRVRELYRRGCKLKSYEACARLAVMLNQGFGGDKNNEEASKLFSLACKKGDKLSCKNLMIVKRQVKNAWKKKYPDCMRLEKLFNQCSKKITALVQAKVAIHYKLGGEKWGKKALKIQKLWVEDLRKLCYRWHRFYSKKLNLKGGPRKYRDEWERGFWRRQDKKNLSKLQSLLPAKDCDSLIRRIEPLLLK